MTGAAGSVPCRDARCIFSASNLTLFKCIFNRYQHNTGRESIQDRLHFRFWQQRAKHYQNLIHTCIPHLWKKNSTQAIFQVELAVPPSEQSESTSLDSHDSRKGVRRHQREFGRRIHLAWICLPNSRWFRRQDRVGVDKQLIIPSDHHDPRTWAVMRHWSAQYVFGFD